MDDFWRADQIAHPEGLDWRLNRALAARFAAARSYRQGDREGAARLNADAAALLAELTAKVPSRVGWWDQGAKVASARLEYMAPAYRNPEADPPPGWTEAADGLLRATARAVELLPDDLPLHEGRVRALAQLESYCRTRPRFAETFGARRPGPVGVLDARRVLLERHQSLGVPLFRPMTTS
jgi:hypothetical protein